MRPHRLEVVAFGAFAGTTAVDFDNLEGLFLLHGETGAGKTTLLDAIAFALYGRVPGKRGDVRRLRSDHAAAEVRTQVVLEATIGGRRLRITRSPEQDRPKKRGDGFTREQASVLLQELTAGGIWETKSTRVGEADAEIADLMGMSAEQFFQVVLLPQGQFAKFLHADAPDREKLLQKLFGTDRFRSVEDWLAERRRTTADAVRTAAERVDRLVAQVSQAAGLDASDADGVEPVVWIRSLADAATAERDAAQALVMERKRVLDAAVAAQRDVQRLADRQRQRAEALRRCESLSAAAESMDRLRTELAAADRAAEVAPVLAEAIRAGKQSESARSAEQSARRLLPDAVRELDVDALRSAARACGERLGHLEALREVARQAAAEEQAATSARDRCQSLAGQIEAVSGEIETRRAQRPRAVAARDAAQEAARVVVAARSEANRYRDAAGDFMALTRTRAEYDRLDREQLTADKEAVRLHKEALRIREARIDGMRAELAANLVDGAPCPVCGSREHPELCELPIEPVSRDQETEANRLAERASDVAAKAGRQTAAAQARIDELTRRLTEAGLAEHPDLEAEATRLESEANRLARAAAQLPDLQDKLDKIDKAIAAAQQRVVELTQQCSAAEAEAASAQQRADRARESLRAQLDGAADLDAAFAATRLRAKALTDAADAADEATRASADVNRTRDAAADASVAAGFADAEAARAAHREPRWRQDARERIRRYEAEETAARERLTDPELDVALEPSAPVGPADEAVREAEAAHTAALDSLSRADDRVRQLTDLTPELTRAAEALRPLQARAAEARRLADLVAGQGTNAMRMTLSSFVLAARLEEVAAAASHRLLKMTAGRYSLVHTDARRGGKRSGLGLLACDSWTGVDRDTSTLSGGETFLASLSLALGLADVVTAEAAGAPMEALFVDEGFGTLDEDTLDEVMNVLDGLREGGRIVGIVSHVAELKQRIPAQVWVRKGQHGSQVLVSPG
jgi:exonuclease SbcC